MLIKKLFRKIKKLSDLAINETIFLLTFNEIIIVIGYYHLSFQSLEFSDINTNKK